MFTGIVHEVGRVAAFDRGRLEVETRIEAGVGDSVAVDGVCLTVVAAEDGRLVFDVHAETTERAKPFGDRVNVEPALRAGEPLGGHYVQGHVDGTARVRSFDGERLVVEASPQLLRYCVEKGSIALDGVSLTIAALEDEALEIALVPHTLAATTLGSAQAGDELNVEVDVLAKYVERLVGPRSSG